MTEDLNVKIHEFDCVSLGGPDCWDWRQSWVSVPYWRIYWNSSGGSYVKSGGRDVELGPGKVVLIAPHTLYSSRAGSETRHFYAHFSAGPPLASVSPQLFELGSPSLRRLASELASEIGGRGSWRFMLKLAVYLRSALLELPPDAAPPEGGALDPKIAEALRALDERRASNEELADMLNMSRNGFLHLFRKETGVSPQSYSRRKRLDDACVMLHFSDTPIEEVAAAAGFYDRYHFSKAFKREFGVSPGEYRRQERGR